MNEKDDILAAFDLQEIEEQSAHTQNISEENITKECKILLENESEFSTPEIENIQTPEVLTQKQGFVSSASKSFVFLIKYLSTSLCIFWVLLAVSNYSAYSNIIYSFIYAEEMEKNEVSMMQSVSASEIDSKAWSKEVNTFASLDQDIEEVKTEYTPSMHSLWKLIAKTKEDSIDLWIDITPYENRIVIPKIGKNIPLVEITQQTVSWVDELNNIFMEELKNGVIRYPGSAKPGEDGNSFIFGHSSNNVWEEGDYNDVFALLDNVDFEDEVIVYYGQEKYVYKIAAKDVIRPGDVSVLKSDSSDRSQITLMTCWPIGTTLNRLILTWELIHVEW